MHRTGWVESHLHSRKLTLTRKNGFEEELPVSTFFLGCLDVQPLVFFFCGAGVFQGSPLVGEISHIESHWPKDLEMRSRSEGKLRKF